MRTEQTGTVEAQAEAEAQGEAYRVAARTPPQPIRQSPKGGSRTMTAEQVGWARVLYAAGLCSQEYLARYYGVSVKTIQSALKGWTYKDVGLREGLLVEFAGQIVMGVRIPR